MSEKHTPGCWVYDGDGGYGELNGHRIRSEDDPAYVLAVAIGDVVDLEEQAEANARLIAAAPDLLTAAEALGAMPQGYCFCSRDRIGDDSKVHEPECAAMRAAIVKARGL